MHSLSTGTSLRGTCKKTFHSLKSHAESPLANCKVAFSGAALRCQTAVSACTKWCPSAQKHFRAWKMQAEFTTVPLSCHFIEVTVNFGEGWGGHVHSSTNNHAWMLCCLWKLLDMSGSLTLLIGNCGIYMDTHILPLPSGHPQRGFQMDKNLFDRLICNQWSSPVSLRSSILSLSSFLFLTLSASCSNTTTIAPAPLYLWSVKSLFFPAS